MIAHSGWKYPASDKVEQSSIRKGFTSFKQAAPLWTEKGSLHSVQGQNAPYAPLSSPLPCNTISSDYFHSSRSQFWTRFLARVKAARLTLSWLTVVSHLLFNGINWSGVSSRQHKHLRRSAEVTQRYETMSRGNVCVKIAFSVVSLAFHLCFWTLRLFSFFRKKCKISPDHPQECRLLLKRPMVHWICVCVCVCVCVRTWQTHASGHTHNLTESKPVYTKESVQKISERTSFKGEMCNFCALCLVG